ncbi:MAG: polysaccharide biosynthesis protein [Proteobacteria bacterium]|nr:polysaccharide biosynthesis protein [Pseudomonadota bacterium]MBU1738200.1 polysaccharide biosynthesis protein [Pseudomonadota bacterium]
MKKQLRKINFWILLILDSSILVGIHFFAYYIRFEGDISDKIYSIRSLLPILVPFKICAFSLFRLYRGMWRYTGLTDLMNVFKASLLTTFMVLGILVVFNRFEGFSRSVFILDGLLTFLFIAGLRMGLRLYYQRSSNFSFALGRADLTSLKKKLLIVGAGDAAEKVVREIKDNRSLPHLVVGFLDDNQHKIGNLIHGIPVLGVIDELHEFVVKTKAQEVLIAIPSATRDQISRIVELCRTSKVKYKTLPGLGEIITDKVSVKAIRDVSYKDLLGRPPVRLELESIGGILENRVVVVSGAGGSIGSELCRQIIRFKPKMLILFDSGEENLYRIEMEILHELGFKDYKTILGRVEERALLEDVFERYRPDVVFHAAAYKHVPMIEENPWEAVTNNIMATRRIIEASVNHHVDRFILVSTDKAVRPTNVMGASKRMTELIMQAYCADSVSKHDSQRTRFMAVRFGNVIGSSGSVIPLFKRQIEMGGPVTVTDPDMTRYFMSIEEAAQLILQAGAMGDGGEIFILEMGTPVRIAQMARDLIRLCGKEPDSEIEVKYIGLRPGEKLYEELITEGEGIVPTMHEKIMVLKGNGVHMQDLADPLYRLEQLASEHDGPGIKKILKEVIPEYTPKDSPAVL